jgi:hypothetical protein
MPSVFSYQPADRDKRITNPKADGQKRNVSNGANAPVGSESKQAKAGKK